MAHRVTAIRCSYVKGNLVLTSVGMSPRGTKVLLRKEVVANYDPKEEGARIETRRAIDKLLARIPD